MPPRKTNQPLDTTIEVGEQQLSLATAPSHLRYQLAWESVYTVRWLTRSSRTSSDLDPPLSVEQMIADGYLAVPVADPLTAILDDDTLTARLGLDDAISQLRQRYALWQAHMADIEQAKLAASNTLHAIESKFGPATPEQLNGMHTSLQRLYQEERDARLHLWRDLSRIKINLPAIAREYLAAYRKSDLLSGSGGGL